MQKKDLIASVAKSDKQGDEVVGVALDAIAHALTKGGKASFNKTRGKLVSAVAHKAGVSTAEAKKVVNITLDIIIEVLVALKDEEDGHVPLMRVNQHRISGSPITRPTGLGRVGGRKSGGRK